MCTTNHNKCISEKKPRILNRWAEANKKTTKHQIKKSNLKGRKKSMKKRILNENNRALKYRMVKRAYTHTERVFVYQFGTALFVVWHSSRKGEKYLIYKFVDILKLPIWCYCSKSCEKNTASEWVWACLLHTIRHTLRCDWFRLFHSQIRL